MSRSEKNFAIAPSVSISRSKFIRKSQHKTAFNLGDIVPIYVDEVLPGDTRKINMASLVRMSTPIVPIMDNIYVDYYAFFCPNRLAWTHWKEFMGENTTTAGIYQGTEYTIPQSSIANIGVNSIGDYMGLPVGITLTAGNTLKVSELPLRMYYLIYNRWFRDQNLIDPIAVGLGDSASSDYSYASSLLKAAKFSDYFTRSLPYAQKGAAVSLPQGTSAPVSGDVVLSSTGNLILRSPNGTNVNLQAYNVPAPERVGTLDAGYEGGPGINYEYVKLKYQSGLKGSLSNAFADLSQTTAATINDLRFAFQYQKLLEKDAMYGTRYWELLKAHFSVDAPDASLQDPEYLGHYRMNVNIDQVLQTTGQDVSDPSQNELGSVGANSVSGSEGNLFTKSFVEHGYIMIMAVARHEQTYGQGINRSWSRLVRNDFYFPVFANLGAQKVLNKEVFAQGVNASDELTFGFQEAWAEYRYKSSIVSSILKPSVANSLGYWTLANNFASLPTLGKTFIEQDRNNLVRALVSGSNGPDFVADFYFEDTAVRPMPVYSVPGLIDHH